PRGPGAARRCGADRLHRPGRGPGAVGPDDRERPARRRGGDEPMIRLITKQRLQALEATEADADWLLEILNSERAAVGRLRTLLAEARAEAVAARDAGAAVSAEAVALYERERERADGLEALARLAADPGIPAPQRINQWC